MADVDRTAATHHGRQRASPETAGTPISPLHTQIAAHALALDATLVTHNLRKFKRVPGLKPVNWADPAA